MALSEGDRAKLETLHVDTDTWKNIEALNYNASREETYMTLYNVFLPSFTKFPEKIPDIIGLLGTEDMQEIIQFQVC